MRRDRVFFFQRGQNIAQVVSRHAAQRHRPPQRCVPHTHLCRCLPPPLTLKSFSNRCRRMPPAAAAKSVISRCPIAATRMGRRGYKRRPTRRFKLAMPELAAGRGGVLVVSCVSTIAAPRRVLSDLLGGPDEPRPCACWIVFHSPQAVTAPGPFVVGSTQAAQENVTEILAMPSFWAEQTRATSKAKRADPRQSLL